MDNLKKIVLASSNTGKIRELTQLLQPLQIEVLPQSAFNIPDVEETGLTFVENAILKARNASAIAGLPALADDSGLAVDALNGKPGIHSARYAGTNGDAKRNIEKLLHDMQTIADNQRQAAFHCVLALLLSPEDPTPIICHGEWHGIILRAPNGEQGFGYDPVFYVPSEQKTAAELPPEIKNALSHRGQALRTLVQTLHQRKTFERQAS